MITKTMKTKLRTLARDMGYIAIFTPTHIKMLQIEILNDYSSNTFENNETGYKASEAMLLQRRKRKQI
jgi:hypothetical protein